MVQITGEAMIELAKNKGIWVIAVLLLIIIFLLIRKRKEKRMAEQAKEPDYSYLAKKTRPKKKNMPILEPNTVDLDSRFNGIVSELGGIRDRLLEVRAGHVERNKEIKGEVGKIDKQLKFIDKIVPEADNDR